MPLLKHKGRNYKEVRRKRMICNMKVQEALRGSQEEKDFKANINK